MHLHNSPAALISVQAGRLAAQDAGAKGSLSQDVQSASWAFSVRPELGWGSPLEQQKATAGWLASLPVFEPHWQVVSVSFIAYLHQKKQQATLSLSEQAVPASCRYAVSSIAECQSVQLPRACFCPQAHASLAFQPACGPSTGKAAAFIPYWGIAGHDGAWQGNWMV